LAGLVARAETQPLSLSLQPFQAIGTTDNEAAILPSTFSLHTALRVIKLLQLIQHMLHINFEQSIANISS
jgi:hypothetical protein